MLSLRWHRLQLYLELMRFDRPIGTFLVLWPALWALFIAANGLPSFQLIAVFTIGAFLMRSAGCVINDYADRDWDGAVARTQQRPLANGRMQPSEALQLFLLLCLTAAILLVFLEMKVRLWALGALFLASLYPFTKRATHFPQVILGMAFGWSVPMAYVAELGHVNTDTWLLFAAVTLWVVIYDTFYAMVDRDDDLKVGIKSTAIFFGKYDRKITAFLQILFIALMIALGLRVGLSYFYYIGCAVAAGLFIYQQWLVRFREPENCFKAFLNNNYVGLAIFLGVAIDTLQSHYSLVYS